MINGIGIGTLELKICSIVPALLRVLTPLRLTMGTLFAGVKLTDGKQYRENSQAT